MTGPKIKRKESLSVQRPSLLVTLKLSDKTGSVLDESKAWDALVSAFANHPTLEIQQAEISPDREGSSIQ